MTEVGGTSSGEEVALALFEEFLIRHHEDGEGLETFCAAAPEHAAQFRSWWARLVEAGEVEERRDRQDALVELRGGLRFAHYRLVHELGRGAQAEVWLAEDERLGRSVALKILRVFGGEPGRASRFAREAELASRLDHPGLCTVFERGGHRGAAFLAMRYVEGETLGAAIARHKVRDRVDPVVRLVALDDASDEPRAALEAVLGFFAVAAEALHTAHEAGLVHRDVKPENLLVQARRARPVILDFGLAQDVDSGSSLTRTGDAVGTPAYMSPEQVLGVANLDRRTDIWSLGATLFEALTGRRPFEAATRAELQRAIQHTSPPPLESLLPNAPRDLRVLVATCLARHPGDRYANAELLAADLRRVVRGEPILARPLSRVARAVRWAQREPVIAGSLSAAFVALAVALAVSLLFGAEARRARLDAERSFARLADEALLRRAHDAAVALHPIEPGDAPALGAWLAEFGEPLAVALPGHRAELVHVRARGGAPSEAERRRLVDAHPQQRELARLQDELEAVQRRLQRPSPGERGELLASFEHSIVARIAAVQREIDDGVPLEFTAASDRALHDGLARLVAELEAFVGEGGLLQRMRTHHDWARSAGEHDAAAWQAAAAAVAADRRFDGLALPVLPGFAPLGADPDSGLQEFAWLRSGNAPQREQASGRLLWGDDPAVVFVLVPGATYLFGRPEHASQAAERFQKPVILEPFLIAKHEISRRQWTRITGRAAPEGGFLQVLLEPDPDLPVEGLVWEEVDAALHEHGLVLPTEAQWEYACSANTATRYWWGDLLPTTERVPDNLRDRAYDEAAGVRGGRLFGYDDGFAGLAPVRADFAPNGFGLVSVYGNVAEWCREASMGRVGLANFEAEPVDGFHRVPRFGNYAVRGGAFETPPRAVHSGSRHGVRGGVPQPGVGVRPVRSLPR